MGKKRSIVMLMLLTLFFFFFFSTTQAIWLSLPSSGTKCVSDEIQSSFIVLADYVVIAADHSINPTISVKGVELELRKLEGAVEAIHENLIYLKGREAEMRSVNETTNTRVAMFSILSLTICIAVSALQLWNLKRYFQKKKLIKMELVLIQLQRTNFCNFRHFYEL